MPLHCFVTGTDTGVGKTHAAIALLHALRRDQRLAVGMKPVASGADLRQHGLRNADALDLLSASDPQPDYACVNPYCFAEPTAPEIAAARMGSEITLTPITTAFTSLCALAPNVVVEGVGGFMAPLSAHLMQADIARALRLPVILVVGMRLGCINHALLTEAAIDNAKLPFLGWIANAIDPDLMFAEAYFNCLRDRLSVPCLGYLPHAHPAHLAAAYLSEGLSAYIP